MADFAESEAAQSKIVDPARERFRRLPEQAPGKRSPGPGIARAAGGDPQAREGRETGPAGVAPRR